MTTPRDQEPIPAQLVRRRVLVVDDSKLWRDHARSVVGRNGTWELVGEASDGAEAVQQATSLRPDLILLDVSLPTLNGIQVAQRVLRADGGTRILFISEHRSWEIAEAALRTGAHGYVVKADAGRELQPAMNAIADGRRFISARFGGRRLDETTGRVPWENRCHEAAFSSDETVLLNDYARFAENALRAGESLIVCHSKAGQLPAMLEARGVDIDRAIKDGRYQAVDVPNCFLDFLVDGWPNEARFRDAATFLVMKAARAATSEHPRVAACGDGTSTLWREGRGDAAVRVEQLWDDLAIAYQLDIFCGFPMSPGDEHTDIYHKMCAAHSAVHSR